MDVETRDISLAGPDHRPVPGAADRRAAVDDALAELGELAKKPEANIIKLPNVSASIPQLKAAIKELQEQGYDLPDYPEDPQTDEDKRRPRALRQGQGLRGQPGAARGQLRPPRAGVGQELRQDAPAPMGAWSPDSKTNVATMGEDDFRSNEKSVVIEADDTLRIEHVGRRRHRDRAQGRRSRCSPARSSTARS